LIETSNKYRKEIEILAKERRERVRGGEEKGEENTRKEEKRLIQNRYENK
jgi:hypothetical protein